MSLPTPIWIQEEVMRMRGKDVRVVYLVEPLDKEEVQELENVFKHLIAHLPFSLTKEIRRELEKIALILRTEETLRDVADEITRYEETIRGADIRLTIGERVAMLERLEKWRKTVKERLGL